ncbi:hypothetical protein ES708_23992 [subsurface metagenome]
MKKFILISLHSILPLYLFGQQITPEVIVSSGNYHEGSNVSIAWSLGEIVIETLTENTITLTQGFQQPYYSITSIKEIKDDRINISVFPNPTNDFIKVQIDNPKGLQIIVEISDATGRILKNSKIINNSGIEEFDLLSLTPGIYFLKIWSKDMSYTHTFLIQKISK